MTYIIKITITDKDSALTKIIQTLRRFQCGIQQFKLNKDEQTEKSEIKIKITSQNNITHICKSLKKIEGVHEICETTQ